MRDLVVYSLLSLDGVAEEPGDWMLNADDEVFENLAGVISLQDDILLGRGTYDYWAEYWPSSDVQPFADFINQTTKHAAPQPLQVDTHRLVRRRPTSENPQSRVGLGLAPRRVYAGGEQR